MDGRPQPAASVDYILGYPAYYDTWSFFKTHNSGSNFTTVDGHVKWFLYGKVDGTQGPIRGKDAWFVLAY